MSTANVTKVVLILGAGSRVGSNVASLFASKGYKVGLAARRLQDEINDDGHLNIKADFTKPETIDAAFEKLGKAFGPPNVVIYNAASATFMPAKTPLELKLTDFERDMALNTTGALVAAKQAVEGFKQLPKDAHKTFIFTGNCTNVDPIPAMLSAGMGKAATANLIHTAAMAYKDEGYRFYYADERTAEGKPAYGAISGPGHAQYFYELSEAAEQGPWLSTFVTGKGYQSFAKM